MLINVRISLAFRMIPIFICVRSFGGYIIKGTICYFPRVLISVQAVIHHNILTVDYFLIDVVAYVDVRSNNDNRFEGVARELERMGATVSNWIFLLSYV